MNVQTTLNEVKSQLEVITTRGQELAQISFETVKTANGILVEGVQTLIKTETAAAEGLFEAVKGNFEKASQDGLKAVAANPIAYLPTEEALVVVNEGLAVVTKTSETLGKTLQDGYVKLNAAIKGEVLPPPVVVKAAKKASKTVKKAAKAA
jgi:hypothetical protein